MPTLKVEQYKKWTSALPEGWKFDVQCYVVWGEKKIFTNSAENENGAFYRLTLEYKAETEPGGYFRKETGKQIPVVSISRYTPTSAEKTMFSVVHIMTENAADPESKKKYDVLCKIAAALDVNDYFNRAAEKDTGKSYNDFCDFCANSEPAAESANSAEQETEEETKAAEQAENTAEEETAADTEESAENGKQTEDAQTVEASAPDESTEDAPSESAEAAALSRVESVAAVAVGVYVGDYLRSYKRQMITEDEAKHAMLFYSSPLALPAPQEAAQAQDQRALVTIVYIHPAFFCGAVQLKTASILRQTAKHGNTDFSGVFNRREYIDSS